MGKAAGAPRIIMPQASAAFVLGDLDALFSAVTARLRGIALGAGEPAESPVNDANDRVRTVVLECVSALDQLHVMLAHEVERRERLELFVDETQAALAHAPPELVAVLEPALRVLPNGGSPWSAHAP
jgi:hypothetical protein